jgi:crotonobetainyl-CoA:carnitine CoA-transferase CaiB-like acyl-CoA transferase
MKNTKSALAGIRVLDLSRVLAGPWATQILADLGAEIIKIENPHGGDDTRGWGPPFLKDTQGNDTHESAYFLSTNRGKKSVAIDISSQEGQLAIQTLAKSCDVMVENFKVGGLKKYQLDYDSIKAINPSIIYCSITGFGQTGPAASHAGYDFMIQGMGGLMSITGEPDAMPMKAGVAVTDIMTGLYATIGIQAALLHREKTGIGQHIDVALLDVQVATLANQAMNYLISGQNPARLGNAHPNIVPYQAFATQDGHFILAIGNDKQFEKFCHLLQKPELAQDARFITNQQRVQHRNALLAILIPLLKTQSTTHWLTLCEAHQIPCGPINTLQEVFAHPQIRHNNMVIELPHATGMRVPLVANPLRLSETPPHYDLSPPLLGEHTNCVLKNI